MQYWRTIQTSLFLVGLSLPVQADLLIDDFTESFTPLGFQVSHTSSAFEPAAIRSDRSSLPGIERLILYGGFGGANVVTLNTELGQLRSQNVNGSAKFLTLAWGAVVENDAWDLDVTNLTGLRLAYTTDQEVQLKVQMRNTVTERGGRIVASAANETVIDLLPGEESAFVPFGSITGTVPSERFDFSTRPAQRIPLPPMDLASIDDFVLMIDPINDTTVPSDLLLTFDEILLVGNMKAECNPDSLGDIDGNGMVGFADFLILSGNFGKPAMDHTDGDLNCGGSVDFADFLILSKNFGTSIGVAAVPEPNSMGLMMVAGMMLLCNRNAREVRGHRHTSSLIEMQPQKTPNP